MNIMQVVSDFHLHSKYSRAVSQNMILPTIAQVAAQKGFQLLSISDFTHPMWFKETTSLLKETGEGVYSLEMGSDEMRSVKFIWSVEISSIYKQNDRLRRIHNLIFMPHTEAVEKFTTELKKRGANLSADGRPIVGFTSRDLLEMALNVDGNAFLIPAHVWTPHFGLFGSASGFDSIDEAFGDLAPFIYGIETGLSSDPEMNWQIDELKNRSILSFSDAHSPAKMGREATVFELEEISFGRIKDAINKASQRHTKNHVLYTTEFFPEEGKYHYSGHRDCKIFLSPDEIKAKGNICPVCHRKLTEGVFVRLQQLAGRDELTKALSRENAQGLMWHTDPKKHHPPFVRLVPLLEIVAESLSSTVASLKSQNMYKELLKHCGTEIDILLKVALSDIRHIGGERLSHAVAKVRKGNISIRPGFDGEFGKISIWGENEAMPPSIPQLSLNI